MSNEVDSVGELLDKVVEIEKNRTKKHHPDAPRAEVVRKGVKMIVPETMGLLDAAKVLVNQAIYEDKEVSVREIFDYPIPDGALAFRHALEERYGVIAFEDYEKQGMFGPVKVKAQSMTVRIGPNQTTQVPWGQVEVPALGGFLVSDSAVRGGRPPFIFSVTGTIKRRYEGEFQALCHDIRLRLAEHSIYRGKAIRVAFTDEDHDSVVVIEPSFLDLSGVKPDELIFESGLGDAIDANLYTPIQHSADCRKAGIPLKRGILLAGPYGTGKTLAAYVAALRAEQNGWTFVYVEKASDLPLAIRFAMNYEPAVIFCEDIDRTTSGIRDAEQDRLLNLLDGLESKSHEMVVVFTTNDLSAISPALLRPGRLDAVINVRPPDAKAAERLLRLYGRHLIPASESLKRAGAALEGQIPAIIREAVERSKLTAISRRPGSTLTLTEEDILGAADSMRMHWELLTPPQRDDRSDIEKAASIIVGVNGAAH